MNKKIILLVLLILLLMTLSINLSYAYYSVDIKKGNNNTFKTNCFNIETDLGTTLEKTPITINNAYPITDNEAKYLKPFTFKIKNICNKYSMYQINLETLNTSSISSEFIKVKINDSDAKLLSNLTSQQPTLQNSIYATKLEIGGLYPKEEKEFNIVMYLDEKTTLEDAKNKVYESKIIVNVS